MHALINVSEARAIANSYGLSLTDEKLSKDIQYANSFANTVPTPNALASRQWCDDHPRTVRTKLYDPREAVAYWYVQMADERRMDAMDAARNEMWAYG